MRTLGRTGLRLSALGFGASSLGGVFHSLREEDGIQAVFAAIESGINFIDVSPYYGYYKAEQVLGKALRQIPRDRYILSTKVVKIMCTFVSKKIAYYEKSYWNRRNRT